jgi:hypothetical protein
MYRCQDRKTLDLFPRVEPFGGLLDPQNRWLQMAPLLPWDEYEREYLKLFQQGKGRPGKDVRIAVGSLIIKHIEGFRDEEVAEHLQENVYMQYFCGVQVYEPKGLLERSSLSRIRRRIGVERLQRFESYLVAELVKRKIVQAKGLLVDATVTPVDVTYPNDVGLLEKGRRYLVSVLKDLGPAVGQKYRTYCRVAREPYPSFSKKRRKTKREVRQALKSVLQHVRRNVGQVREVVRIAKSHGRVVGSEMQSKLKVIEEILAQQWELYRQKSHRIKGRIVSLCQPHIRPQVRGKSGADVEFGPKVSWGYVDGFCFADVFSFDAFNESEHLPDQIRLFQKRFGRLPEYVGADAIYGTRADRKFLKEQGIKAGLRPLGREPAEEQDRLPRRWRKKIANQRGILMEGIIGHGKRHLGLDLILARGKDMEQMWVQLSLMAMNLHTAMKRV